MLHEEEDGCLRLLSVASNTVSLHSDLQECVCLLVSVRVLEGSVCTHTHTRTHARGDGVSGGLCDGYGRGRHMKVRDAAVDVGAADRRSVSVLLGFGCAVLWDSVTINNCDRTSQDLTDEEAGPT